MSDVKRYVTTCDCMNPAAWGDYVRYDDYAALESELARLRAGQEPVRFWFIGDAGQQKGATYCKKSSRDGSLAFFECEEDAKRAALRHPGTEVYPVEYYRKPQATPQPSAVPDGLPLVLAGVLFDFAGFLTTRPKVIKVGATANASPMADLAKEFSELRGLSLDDAAVLSWQELLAAAPSAPATVQGDGWIPVSKQLPESERTVLAFYLNSHGKGRRVRAEYIAAKTKSADDGWDSDEPADYDEQADEYFWPAGWYEVMDNWDDLTHMVIHEGEVTHWMPMPESPAIDAARKEGGKV